jgi:2-methylcitrate dehydratase PrpD
MGSHEISADASEQTLDAFIALSQSLRWQHVPQSTRASVRRELLDYLGAAIAGRAAAGLPTWL